MVASARLVVTPRAYRFYWLGNGPAAAASVSDFCLSDDLRERIEVLVVDLWAAALCQQDAVESATRAAFLISAGTVPRAGGTVAAVDEAGQIEWQASPGKAAARLSEAGVPGLRFTYSYAINAIPILGRVSSETTRRVPGPPDANASMPDSWLTEPLALQMLYRIARGPRDMVADLDAGWISSNEQPAIRLDRQRVGAVEQSLRTTELVRRVSGAFRVRDHRTRPRVSRDHRPGG